MDHDAQDSRPLSRESGLGAPVRRALTFVQALLILAILLGLPIFLEFRQARYLVPIVQLLLAVALFVITTRSERVARFLSAIRVDVLLPAFSGLLDKQKRRYENAAAVDKMEERMRFYGLGVLPAERRKSLVEWDSRLVPIVKQSCLEIAAVLKKTHTHVSAGLLELLYEERYGTSAAVLWSAEKNDLAGPLAIVLAESGTLPTAAGGLPHNAGVLALVAGALPEFRFEVVQSKLRDLDTIWLQVMRFSDFLEKNGVQRPVVPPEKTVSMFFEDATAQAPLPRSLEPLEHKTLIALRFAGETALRQTFPQLPDTQVDTLCLIALAMFFTEFTAPGGPLEQEVCRDAAGRSEALHMALAYLEFREILRQELHLEGRGFVSVHYLASHWAPKIAEKREELEQGLDKELRVIEESLRQGQWITRLPLVVERTYEKIRKDLEQKLADLKQAIERRSPLETALRRVFQNLKLSTIERLLESREITAYLLTFDALSGAFADLIDCLLAREPAVRQRLESQGIALNTNGHPKYVFKNYTSHTRIGLVPKGWTFEGFFSELQQDLVKIINDRTELLRLLDTKGRELGSIELIVHRFGLTGRDLYALRPDPDELRRPHALPKVRQLFSETLSVDDLVAVIGYEQREVNEKVEMQDILAAMTEGPIAELAGSELDDRERRWLEQGEQQEGLRQQLLRALGCRDAASLARCVFADRRQYDAAVECLAGLLQAGLPQVDPQRPTRIAREYIETLSVIAGIA